MAAPDSVLSLGPAFAADANVNAPTAAIPISILRIMDSPSDPPITSDKLFGSIGLDLLSFGVVKRAP
jgi:hypothetical protein